MKNTILSAVVLGALALLPVSAQETQIPHVTVYGTATTEVTPDQMIWSVNVNNKGAQLEAVAAEHAKIVDGVLRFLKGAGVDGASLQTSRMEFGENWDYQSSIRVRQGYFASTQISFKLADFDAYNKIWLGLSRMSDVSVQGVTFDHTKRIAYQNETRQKAVLAAREKAMALASALGSQIGEPLFIGEDITVNSPWNGNAAANNLRSVQGGGGPQMDSVAPGKIPITTRVQASFRLITEKK